MILPSTVSVTELIWTPTCGVGAYYAVRLFKRSLRSIASLRRNKINSIREYSAQLTVFTYFLIMFVQVAFVLVGIVAMTAPPPHHSDPITGLQLIITVAFILVSFVLATGSYIIEQRRQILINKIESMEDGFKGE